MREVLGAGRGVQAGEAEIPAMAAGAGRRETRQGAESDELFRAVNRVLLGQPRCVAFKLDRAVLVPKLPYPSYRNKRNGTITQSLLTKLENREREGAVYNR